MKKNKKQKGEILTATVLGICAVASIVGYTRLISLENNLLNNISGDIRLLNLNFKNREENVEVIDLSSFVSKEELLEKLKLAEKENNRYLLTDVIYETSADFSTVTSDNFSGVINSPSMADGMASSNGNKVAEVEQLSDQREYSTTNTQVIGVDEGDIVKTNGNYIYYISKGNLYIFNVKELQPKLEKTIKIEDSFDYYPQELYIDDDYITVIAQGYKDREKMIINPSIEDNEKYNENKEKELYDTIAGNYISRYSTNTNLTSMYVYDINTYNLVKEVQTEGSYVSSRKIDNNIYMVTNRYIYTYKIDENSILPIFKDSSVSTETYNEIPAQKVKYFPDVDFGSECNYMLITSLDLNNINDNVLIDTYLGAGTEIYSSKDNLYVTRVEYNYKNNSLTGMLIDTVADVVTEAIPKTAEPTDNLEKTNIKEEKIITKIHKFKLLDGAVKYVATGEVPGTLLNQYSMDENNEYFRITTTSENGNNLYILDGKLQKVGELKNLARGEKIYATRFMGSKCYIVTYKTVDPLFVIDLSQPSNPTVLGELKIPGYSTYLHPLGDNYLIGFGEDSIEKSYTNWQGEQEVIAYNTGLKLAIFDITDLSNPKELHSIKIGGRGSSSELLSNPRVLYYDEEKEIFAFPASLTEETKFYQDGTPMYGDTIFQGALVYNLSVEDGISLRGKIEHKELDKLNYYKNIGFNIERIISIEDNFYTISPSMIMVTDIETMEEVNNITI